MNGALKIGSAAGGAISLGPQMSVEAPPSKGRLVFRCCEKSCFLAQIWGAGNPIGTELLQSRSEREVAKGHTPKPAVVMGASLR